MIAWFGAGQFSHVDAVLHHGYLMGARHDSLGGKPPGVWARPPGYDKWTRRVVMEVPATPEQTKAFYDFMWAQEGKPYDSEAIWGFIVGRDWREDDSWICSEVVTAAGEASVLPQLFLAKNRINPGMCAMAYSAIGGKATECTP
jgi:hypothetical protein